ncbi:unnamed protein product [Didymodactylos carnosus]|uniref:Uncharacterized protein n=1 Tax=Didymodactylos carnosus TaxID=1234261 RepID=A0A8S2TEN8_9BILA|nr:unnamed protein product [Didymodactylos carnosus]CAF4283233.1 unnamed protein product [Didymodactylos carnosus]
MQGYYGDDYASPSECIVRVRGILKRITNINRTTSVHSVIEALLFNTYEDALEPSDCCLYMERDSCLFPLRPNDYMQDLLLRYSTRNRAEILFTLAFKRIASPSRLKQRYAQRKKLMRSTLSAIDNNHIPAVTEQLRTQESLIRRQQEIISELQKVVLNNGTNSKNYYNCNRAIQNERTRDHKENGSRKSRYDVISQSREKENAGKQCYFPQQNNLPSKTRHSSSLQRRTKVRFNENTEMKKNLFEQLIDDYNLLKKSKEQQPMAMGK